MDISKLEEGMVLKSYRELCEVLGIEVKSGGAKRSQMVEIERYVRLKKGKGYSLVVDEVYDSPLLDLSSKGETYGSLAQLLLVDYFIETKQKNIVMSTNLLAERISLINNKYTKNKRNVTKYSKSNGYDVIITNDFYNNSQGTLNHIIESSLKNLENKSLILYTTEYIVKPVDDKLHRAATTHERNVILAVRNELLDKYKYKSLSKVLFSRDRYRFFLDYDRRLREEIDVEYAYKGYKIDILQEEIVKQHKKMLWAYLTDTERIDYKDDMNKLIVTGLLENAVNRQNKALEEQSRLGFGSDNNKLKNVRRTEGYIDTFKKIVDDNIQRSREEKEGN